MYIYDWPGDEGVNSDVHIYSYIVPGGGGVLSVQKGTDCGPTAGEWWLSRPETAKKRGGGGAVLILYCRIGELSESVQLIFLLK